MGSAATTPVLSSGIFMNKEICFGVIPVRKKGGEWQVLLLHHAKGSFWAFPKGHPDKDEAPHIAAARELNEETGLSVVEFLDLPTISERYQFKRDDQEIDKSITYYFAKVDGDLFVQEEEILEGRWLNFDEAINQATFTETLHLIQEARDLLTTDL